MCVQVCELTTHQSEHFKGHTANGFSDANDEAYLREKKSSFKVKS